MIWPKVTVVTPSLNQGKFIRRTVESVLSQHYTNLEYIVVDGGSTDETLAILATFAGRLTVIHEEQRGQSRAINRGFQIGRGEVMAWLNSDDTYLPGAIERSVTALRRTEAWLSYGKCCMIDAEDRLLRDYDLRCRSVADPFDELLNADPSFIPQPTVFMRREVINTVGMLDESLEMCMDYEYWLRVTRRHAITFIRHPIATIRIHPGTKSSIHRYSALREMRQVRKHYAPRALSIFYPRQVYRFLKNTLSLGSLRRTY